MKPVAIIPLLVIALFYGYAFSLEAQTRLEPGDLAIIQVNANNSDCGGTAIDRVSFICFKDITAGTSIDITDNGWERLSSGQWGNSEGFVRATRSGNTIPAGTVITFEFPLIGVAYRAILPDDTWTFSAQGSVNNVNLNSGGEQFYFMQGGIWNQGTGTPGNFNHNATYAGGRILYGFNTKTQWLNNDSSQDSKLHPEVANCFNMAPGSGASDFMAYTGLGTSTTQLEWISRIANPNNWQTVSSCRNLPPIPPQFTIANSGISMQCTTCRGCDTIDEVLRLTLPATGGPFIFEYSDGLDTFQVAQAQNNDSIRIQVGETTTFFIVSVTDANGCPVYSNFGRPVTVSVTSGVNIQPLGNPVVACSDGQSQQAIFDLTALEGQIKGNTSLVVQWFRDPSLNDTINEPQQFTSGPTTIYAITTDGVCQSQHVPVVLELANPPSIRIAAGDTVCGATCARLPLAFQGRAPYILGFIINEGDSTRSNGIVVTADQDTLVFCPFRNGTTSILFSSIIDGNGCPALVNERSTILTQGVDTTFIRRELCQGEQLLVNGQVYDENRPSGTERLSTAAGCDSIVVVALRFSPRPNGRISGDTTICGGGLANLRFQLSGGSRFDLSITNGSDTIPFLGVRNGTVLPVILSNSATFTLLTIKTTTSDCVSNSNSTARITISEPKALVQKISELTCVGFTNGAARVDVQNGKAPYRYTWSNGATTQEVNNFGVGSYQVIVRDSAGCLAAPANISFQAPDSLRVRLTSSRYGSYNISCHGESDGSLSAQVIGGQAPFTYQWSNGATTNEIENLSAGSYRVIAVDSTGCTSAPISVILTAPDSTRFEYALDTAACPGQSNQLSILNIVGAGGPYAYSLDNAAFIPFKGPLSIKDISPGLRRLRLRDGNNCIDEKSITIPNSSDLKLELGPDRNIFAGDSILLKPQLNFNPASVTWQAGSSFQPADSNGIVARPSVTTVFQITAKSMNGCILRDNLTVLVEKRLRVYAPNAFSPNGDNQNDFFTLYFAPEVEGIRSLHIYDRWGSQVFTHEDSGTTSYNTWDGNINGQKAPIGVYVFVAEIRLRTGKTEIIRGSFTLLR